MTKNQILRVVAFCLVVCLMLVFLNDLFELENSKNYCSRFYTYRKYPDNTVDAVFIGTSGVDRYWMASRAYEEYGMTVYPLSIDAMPAWLYSNVLEYALEYQSPKLAIIDVRAYYLPGEVEKMDVTSRRVLSAMPSYSPIWFQTAFKSMRIIHEADNSKPRFDVSFLMSFIRFHSKWEEAGWSFLKNNLAIFPHQYNGFYTSSKLSAMVIPLEPAEEATEQIQVNDLAVASFHELLELAKEKGVELLFVDTPQMLSTEEKAVKSAVYELVANAGYEVVHYYADADEEALFTIPLDPALHFYNSGHVNFEGARIYTDAFAAFLDENFNLPDRRSDKAVQEHWDGVNDKLEAWYEDLLIRGYESNGEDDDE